MEDPTSIELQRLQVRLKRLLQEFGGIQFATLSAQATWKPALNAYWARDRFIICVDLAGVDKNTIDLNVEPRRISLRGQRDLPEPNPGECPVEQILALEINHGAFERVVTLPEAVDSNRVTAEYHNGMLWIVLPMASAP